MRSWMKKAGRSKMANTVLAVQTIMGPFRVKHAGIPDQCVGAGIHLLLRTMVSFACSKMRYAEPDLPRPYHKVPGGEKQGICMACLAGMNIVV